MASWGEVVRRSCALALVGAGLTVLPAAPAAAQDSGSPVATVAAQTEEDFLREECSDAIPIVFAVRAVVFELDRPATAPTVVRYDVGGSAEPGVDYEALPGEATVPPGADDVTVPVTVHTSDRSRVETLTVSVRPDPAYAVGEPSSVTGTLVLDRDPALPPVECGFRFAEGPPIERQVRVGGRPGPIVVQRAVAPGGLVDAPPGVATFRLVDGTLPPGLSLREDGAFAGTAEAVGQHTTTVEACRTEPPGTCIRSALVVRVVGELPRTGRPVRGPALVGMALLGAGTLALGAGMVRRRPSPP